MEFRPEVLAAKIRREVNQHARRLPRRGSRALAIAGCAVAGVFLVLFFVIPVGGQATGVARLMPETSTEARATRQGTLRWVLPVGAHVKRGELLAVVSDGALSSELAATRTAARTALINYLRFLDEGRFADAVPGAVAALRSEQARVHSGHPRAAQDGEVLLSPLRPGDEIRPGQLVAVVGDRDARLLLRGTFPANARTPPRPGDRIRFRWGAQPEQWATFRVQRVSVMAGDESAADGAASRASASLHFAAEPDAAHVGRLLPGLRGSVEQSSAGQTIAGLAWRTAKEAVDLTEAP